MRINEIITESQDLNELDWKAGVGKVGRGIGQIAAIPQGVGRAIKQGYQAGVQAIGGPGSPPPGSPPPGSPRPQTPYKQIQSLIIQLKPNDKKRIYNIIGQQLGLPAVP